MNATKQNQSILKSKSTKHPRFYLCLGTWGKLRFPSEQGSIEKKEIKNLEIKSIHKTPFSSIGCRWRVFLWCHLGSSFGNFLWITLDLYHNLSLKRSLQNQEASLLNPWCFNLYFWKSGVTLAVHACAHTAYLNLGTFGPFCSNNSQSSKVQGLDKIIYSFCISLEWPLLGWSLYKQASFHICRVQGPNMTV